MTRPVFIDTVNDNAVEEQEQFTVTLDVDNNAYPGVTIDPGSATVDIIDSDSEYIKLFKWHKIVI